MLKNVYEGLNACSEVFLSKEYFCEMYPTFVSSKLCELIFFCFFSLFSHSFVSFSFLSPPFLSFFPPFLFFLFSPLYFLFLPFSSFSNETIFFYSQTERQLLLWFFWLFFFFFIFPQFSVLPLKLPTTIKLHLKKLFTTYFPSHKSHIVDNYGVWYSWFWS